MNFAEQVPSGERAVLMQAGEEIAQAWFGPDGDPLGVVVRVPRRRLEEADITERLTLEDLLTAAGVPNEDVESWQVADETHSGMDGANPELKCILPLPSPGADHLTIYIRRKPPAPAAAGDEGGGPELAPEQWQAMDATWKAVLGLEASIESLRLSMEGVRAEMEAAFKRPLGVEEKIHALQSDVVQWNKAKSRIHYALPKAREYIHRAVWAAAAPERKRLEEIVTNHIEPRVPLPGMDQVREQLGHLQKDRQVLFALGSSVQQECRGILAEIQRALGTLQRNAADRARQKRSAGREKGKHF